MSNRLFIELQRIGIAIHDYLTKHIENEDILFKTNWRHIIPIPFIGKKIPFDVAANNCGNLRLKISVDLAMLNSLREENDYDNYLLEIMVGMNYFLEAFFNEVRYLEHLSIRLEDRAQGNDMFSYSEYNEMVNQYQSIQQERLDAGTVMNDVARVLELKHN